MAHDEPPHQNLRSLQIQVFSSLVVKELTCYDKISSCCSCEKNRMNVKLNPNLAKARILLGIIFPIRNNVASASVRRHFDVMYPLTWLQRASTLALSLLLFQMDCQYVLFVNTLTVSNMSMVSFVLGQVRDFGVD